MTKMDARRDAMAVPCLHEEYFRLFRATRDAIAAGDPVALAEVEAEIVKVVADARPAGLQGLMHAVLGRSEKAHVHFCRMHRRPACPGRAAGA